MTPTRPVLVVALALALPLVLSACGNKGPLVRAAPVPATIDGTPTIDVPVEGETAPADDSGVEEATVDGVTLEDTDPSDETSLPEEEAVPSDSDIAPPEDEPTPEPPPDPVPPAETPNG